MSNKHMKKLSSLIIRKIQTETMRDYFKPMRMVYIGYQKEQVWVRMWMQKLALYMIGVDVR